MGSTNAAKQLLSIVTGIKRLQDVATNRGINTLVFDTSGFVDRARGGLYLKEWKIELLRPDLVVSLQHQRELEPLMAPLRKSSCMKVIDLPVASGIKRKSSEKRIQNRRKKFQYYFSRAVTCTLSISDFPIYDLPLARRYSLTGLLDRFGFCLGLGVILEQNRDKLKIFAPLPDLTGVAALRVGQFRIDPATGLEIA